MGQGWKQCPSFLLTCRRLDLSHTTTPSHTEEAETCTLVAVCPAEEGTGLVVS